MTIDSLAARTVNTDPLDSPVPTWTADVLATDELSRLAGVRFHGTLTVHRKRNAVSSRLEHSISMARLAWYVCERMRVTRPLAEGIFLTALLHDIGHLPFSHILEPLLRSRARRYHEGETSLVARHLLSRSGTIRRIVGKEIADVGLALFTQSHVHPLGEEMLFGTFSLDTIEGIYRAAEPLCDRRLSYDAWELASVWHEGWGGIVVDCNGVNAVIQFGRAKRRLYRKYIDSPRARAAAAMITLAAEHALPGHTSVSAIRALTDAQMLDLLLANDVSRYIISQIRAGHVYRRLGYVNEAAVEDQRSRLSARIGCDPELLIAAPQFANEFPGTEPSNLQPELSVDGIQGVPISQFYPYLEMRRRLYDRRSWYGPVSYSTPSNPSLEPCQPDSDHPEFYWW